MDFWRLNKMPPVFEYPPKDNLIFPPTNEEFFGEDSFFTLSEKGYDTFSIELTYFPLNIISSHYGIYTPVSEQEKEEKNKALSYWKNLDWEKATIYDCRYLLALFYAHKERFPESNIFRPKDMENGKPRNRHNVTGSVPHDTNGNYYGSLFTKKAYDKIIEKLETNPPPYNVYASHISPGYSYASYGINYSTDLNIAKNYIKQLNYSDNLGGNCISNKIVTFTSVPYFEGREKNNVSYGIEEVWSGLHATDVTLYSEHKEYTSYTFKVNSSKIIPSYFPKVKEYLSQNANKMQVKVYNSYQNTITLPDSNLVVNKFLAVKRKSDYYDYTTRLVQSLSFNALVYIQLVVRYLDDIKFTDTWIEHVQVDKDTDETLNGEIEKRLNYIRGNYKVHNSGAWNYLFEVSSYYSSSTPYIYCTDRINFFSNIRGKIRLFADFYIHAKGFEEKYLYNIEIPCRQEGNSLILDYFGCDLLQQINLYSFDALSILNAAKVTTGTTTRLGYGKAKTTQFSFELRITTSRWIVDYTQGDYPFEFV
jgi:hypothetical protein